jgi:NAD(P)H-hydrate epimerase
MDVDGRACPPALTGVPWVSVAQMREIDRLMIAVLGISLARMMENAGRSLAVVARHMLGGTVRGRRVVVLAGPGGNGGGGLAGARHLANAGADVDVRLATTSMAGVTGEQLAILRAMGAAPRHPPGGAIEGADLVVDALLGYSQRGDPRGEVARLVAATEGGRMLALDVPTGLDPDSGQVGRLAVRADVTLTLAAPKIGLAAAAARPRVGRLLLADISVPPELWARVGAGPGVVFDRGPIVAIDPPGETHDRP